MARAAQSYWQVPAPAPPPRPRIRLAILSAQIRRHSVWDVIVKGIVRHLSHRHFELLIYHTGTETDAETQWAAHQAEQFVSGLRNPAEWLRQIRADAPDVLFFPEIGMDPLAGKLAALRLAPLQVTSWGHPITTGLPEMDLFFSGNLLEPPDAQEHYRERLIRLPGTGVCTEWPTVNMAPLPVGYLRPRQPGRVRLLLCQHPCKFEPADMPLIAEVLRACAPCELYVLKSRRLPILGDQAATLLRQAVEAAGLDPHNMLLERAWVDREVFLTLLDAVDLYLDLPAFSGYTTAWQALHLGLPVVTLEGPMLRQRLAAGLLRQMGVTETLAQNSADYVSIAARLATECRDSEAWAARRATVQAAALNADHQVEAVRAFEHHLIDACSRSRPTGV
jgi:predicted O-linked N-acetylglucosamine transferase (SPINDLY family)